MLPSVIGFATCVRQLQLWRDRSLHTRGRFYIIFVRPQGTLPRVTGAVPGSKFNLCLQRTERLDDLGVVGLA